MGTSASSKGPGAGSPLDPAWLDDIQIPNQNPDSSNDIENNIPLVAPPARFSNARRGLGEYVRSGSKESLRKALGHYAKTGMGGSRSLSRRMRTSTKVASGFFNTFRSLRDDGLFELGRTIDELRRDGASANKIIDIVVDHVCPKGGSLDEISARDSGKAALSEFMDNNPDADICKLSDDQIWTLTGMFLGNEIFNRVQLDIGQAFEKQDIPIVDKITRLNEMRDYMQSEISIQLNKIRNRGGSIVNIQQLFDETIRNTFAVYEVEV